MEELEAPLHALENGNNDLEDDNDLEMQLGFIPKHPSMCTYIKHLTTKIRTSGKNLRQSDLMDCKIITIKEVE